MLEFVAYLFRTFRVVSQSVQSHTDQMASCIDTCKIEGNKCRDDLLFSDYYELVWLSFFFSVLDFSVYFLHLSNIVMNKILFCIFFIPQSLLHNLE